MPTLTQTRVRELCARIRRNRAEVVLQHGSEYSDRGIHVRAIKLEVTLLYLVRDLAGVQAERLLNQAFDTDLTPEDLAEAQAHAQAVQARIQAASLAATNTTTPAAPAPAL